MRWRRRPLPAGVTLAPDEHVVARAATADGDGEVVATSHGLWLPGGHVGWHLVSKATWNAGTLTVVVADEVDVLDGGAVLLADQPPRRLRLADPGRLPEAVHRRVTGSIRSRHHRVLPGGGAWFVQRAVPGRDGVVVQIRPDPGTDDASLRRVVAGVASTLESARPADPGRPSSR